MQDKRINKFRWGSLIFIVLLFCSCENSAPNKEKKLLWDLVIADLSKSIDSLQTDLEKCTFLRNFCGNLLDVGYVTEELDQEYKAIGFNKENLASWYHRFKKDEIPANCSVNTAFYNCLLNEFGFKADKYNFGFSGSRYTHVVSLVKIRENDTWKTIIQDPTYCLTYVDDSENAIEFGDFIKFLKAGKAHQIKRQQDFVPSRVIINETILEGVLKTPELKDSCRTEIHRMLKHQETDQTLPIIRTYDNLAKGRCDNFEKGFLDSLEANGFPRNYLYSFLFNF